MIPHPRYSPERQRQVTTIIVLLTALVLIAMVCACAAIVIGNNGNESRVQREQIDGVDCVVTYHDNEPVDTDCAFGR